MAKAEPTKKDEKVTASISFPNADELRDMFPDIELDEEIEINIVGRVTGMHLDDSKEFSHGSITVDVISINGESGKQKDNRKELEDMDKEKE